MSKLIYIPAFLVALVMIVCSAMFTACITIVCLVSYVFGRLFLCPLGKHVFGSEFKSSHFDNGVEVVTRHHVHCAFCDHIERKVN